MYRFQPINNNNNFWKDYYNIRPTVKIKVNFIVVQDENGEGNFQNIPNHIDRLYGIIDEVNWQYNNLSAPSDTVGGIILEALPSTKIEFHIDTIVFLSDSSTYNGVNYSDQLPFQNDPGFTDRINIYLTKLNNGASGECNTATNKAVMNFQWNPADTSNIQDSLVFDNLFKIILVHELGHFFDLKHTYQFGASENLNQSDPEFLVDVFGTGLNYIFPHDLGWNCDVFNDTIGYSDTSANWTCTNNIMGGTGTRTYFSPMQIYRMHKRLSLDDRYWKFIKCEEYPNAPDLEVLNLTGTENWDFPIRLFNPIRIKSGTEFELTCV